MTILLMGEMINFLNDETTQNPFSHFVALELENH